MLVGKGIEDFDEDTSWASDAHGYVKASNWHLDVFPKSDARNCVVELPEEALKHERGPFAWLAVARPYHGAKLTIVQRRANTWMPLGTVDTETGQITVLKAVTHLSTTRRMRRLVAAEKKRAQRRERRKKARRG